MLQKIYNLATNISLQKYRIFSCVNIFLSLGTLGGGLRVDQAGLEFMPIFLPQPPKWCDYSPGTLHLI